ncbi:MAG: hypothetical protein JRE72_01850 [Deltaproteobacteria bacterium]|jgi:hypothetical protein|nr:hypothetical protein [Deltaproteobacteria bacterium]
MEKSKFRIFPADRMNTDFPWQIWAIGWLCIFKGIIWLAYEPNMPDNLLSFFGAKYLLGMVPLIICGIGIWNSRKWAVWGAVAICAINLVVFFLTAQSFGAMMVKSEVVIWSILLSTVTLLCNGPVGDLLVILASPTLLKATKKT